MAAFPSMSKAVALGQEQQNKAAANTIEILLCISLPFLISIFFIGDQLLLFIYQDPSFAKEAIILHIVSLSLITGASARILSYLLIANGLEKLNLIEVVVTTVISSLAGIILVSQYQLIGAALMNLTIGFTNFGVMMYFVYDRLFHLNIWQIIRRPLLMSFLMSIIFLVLSQINLNFLLTVAIATAAYVGLASLLVLRKRPSILS